MIEILYDNINPFLYAIGVPLVSISSSTQYRNSRICEVDKITFRGKLKRNCNYTDYRKNLSTENLFGFLLENRVDRLAIEDVFEAKCLFKDLQNDILSRFSQNFKSISIKENGNTLYYSDNAVIESINFDESSYFNLVGFQVQIVVYKDLYAAIGVLDPSEQFEFSDNSDGSVSMTHTISCSAINLNQDSIENAKSFIESKISNTIIPSSWSSFKRILIEKKESCDSLSGKLSAILRYKFSPKDFMGIFSSRETILNYTCNIEFNESNEVIVSLNGSLQGGIDVDMSYIRDAVPEIHFYTIANEFLDHLNINLDLSNKAKSFSFEENKENSIINFSIVFSTKNWDDPYLIDSFTISKNFDENLYCIEGSVEIRSEHGCQQNRMEKVRNYHNEFNFSEFLASRWEQFGTGDQIPTRSRAKSLTIDEFNTSITESNKFCSDVGINCLCFEDLKYSISFSGGIDKYSINPTLEGLGCYSVQNLGYKERMIFSLSGSANVKDCCNRETVVIQIKSICNYLSFKYFNADDKVLEEDSVTYNETKGIVEFQFKWSGKSVITF